MFICPVSSVESQPEEILEYLACFLTNLRCSSEGTHDKKYNPVYLRL